MVAAPDSGHFMSHGPHFIILFAAFYEMIAAILRHHLTHFTWWNDANGIIIHLDLQYKSMFSVLKIMCDDETFWCSMTYLNKQITALFVTHWTEVW